jgi:beta-phosphoglucomutase-like phosphatase (HAD superfamily)
VRNVRELTRSFLATATHTYASSALATGGIEKDVPHLPFLITANLVTHGKPHPEPYLAGLTGGSSSTLAKPRCGGR